MVDISTPGTHWVHFADGMWAEYFKKKLIITPEGTKKYVFILRPSKEIRAHFHITNEDLDRSTGLIIKEYPATEVYICRDDPGLGRIWIFTDFNGGRTEMSERDAEYKERIKSLEKLNRTLRANNARLEDDISKTNTQAKRRMIENVGIIKEALKVRGKEQSMEGMDGMGTGYEEQP